MKKKTLKEKINRVCWWAAGLTVLYFIVGAFLKSDGSKFDPAKTYDLIKDTLTLTAAFLAPVAAFVLFTDWRHEHAIKSLFSLVDEIKKLTQEIENSLKQYMNKIYSSDDMRDEGISNPSESFKISNQLADLSRLYLEITEFEGNTRKFKELINLIGENTLKAKNALEMMDYSRKERKKLENKSNNQLIDVSEIDFLKKFFKENKSIFDTNYKLVSNLNTQLIEIGKLIKEEA